MYDYRKAVKEDVLQYIKDEINLEEFDSLEELEEKLNDELWTEDSVTGNASGSYTGHGTYDFQCWERYQIPLAQWAERRTTCCAGFAESRLVH